jgi:phosphoenolpyruvate-protein kinase (PTS system EI component)
VCGDIASDPAMALLLYGLGFDSISVTPHFVPEIKYAVRQTSVEEARALAAEALEQTTATDVRRILSRIRDRIHG